MSDEGGGRGRGRGRGRGQGTINADVYGGGRAESTIASIQDEQEQVMGQLNQLDLDDSASNFVSASRAGSIAGAQSEAGESISSLYTELRSSASVISVTRKENFNKQGTDGVLQPVMTNYLRINDGSIELNQYRVDFEPQEDDTRRRKDIMRHFNPTIGVNLFDGGMLYTNNLLNLPVGGRLEQTMIDGSIQAVVIRLVGCVGPRDSMYINFYNNVIRTCMTHLGMELLGRNYYNRHKEIELKKDGLVIWPGFATAVRRHEKETLLCAEVTHKVLRTENVLDAMRNIAGSKDFSDSNSQFRIKKELIGCIVISHYNRRTYRIDEIDFNSTPRNTFMWTPKPGVKEAISYADYCKQKHGIEIHSSHMDQPMLVSKPRKKDENKGVKEDIYLVPTLHHMTGLNDEMRKNNDLMKRLSVYLHMDPKNRKAKLDEFMSDIHNNSKVQSELKIWNVKPGKEFVRANARTITKEKIKLSSYTSEEVMVNSDDKYDWSREFKGKKMLKSESLDGWLICSPSRCSTQEVENFIGTFKAMGRQVGMNVSDPLELVTYQNLNDMRDVDKACNRHKPLLKFVFVVLMSNKVEVYMGVKKHITLNFKVPTQCFLAKNLRHKNLNSVATKVIIQVNAKLGGMPWSIQVPYKNMMILGFDVYHCPSRAGYSVGALVASTSGSWSKFHSTISFHKDKSELAKNLVNDVAECMVAFKQENGFLPKKILFFRDGVGDGQINYVVESELEQIKTGISDVCRKDGVELPSITLIIVTKKINSRMMIDSNDNQRNVPPGTILDDVITLPERYDFFLVSQCVRQGTVSPTNYNVVYDDSNIPPDRMQRLAYKMCHLYFNWSGTIAVPAPCLYAHKLAYLTGMALGEKAPQCLSDKLWYL